ncbi:MAG: hypothetical protein ABID54_09925 [Pseudomonadota bacterium]
MIESALRLVSGITEKQRGRIVLIADLGKGVTLSVELPVAENEERSV